MGRKRYLAVDTLGLLLGGLVTPANVSDPAGAAVLLPEVVCRYEIVRAKEGVKGFAVQPHRWIIEHTFAWLTQTRRLVKDYEECEVNSEAMMLIAMSKLMAKRLANYLY